MAANLASDPAMSMARARGDASVIPRIDNICYQSSSTNVIATRDNPGYIIAGMEPGEIVRKSREDRGWSQRELANRVGVSQPAIKKIEDGGTTKSKFLPKLAQVLGIDIGLLDATLTDAPLNTPLPPVGDRNGPRNFEIYAAAEGGPGEILRSADPVDWWPRPVEVQQVKGAYGMYIVGYSMVPEFSPGHVAVINPNLPLVAGKPYIFYGETEDGQVRATVKILRRHTPETWYLTQHNPPPGQKADFTLPRNVWRESHRIVGRHDPS